MYFYNGLSGGFKRINGGLEMKGECFIEIVKIGAGLFHFMRIISEPQIHGRTDTLSQQEGVSQPTGRTRDVAERFSTKATFKRF